jgi:hypothetical protein
VIAEENVLTVPSADETIVFFESIAAAESR